MGTDLDVKPLSGFKNASIRVLLTDIDGTLTAGGRLPSHSYSAMQKLNDSGIKVIPVTGRPAGWCELIARLWPVHGVVGENGAFYFRYDGSKMVRHFVRPKSDRAADRQNLKKILGEVRREVPESGIASDQFCRLFDLAIDFSEDVKPLPEARVRKIVEIFERHGAIAKVSNIHVNGWFGDYDKVSTCKLYLKREFKMNEARMREECAFVGDSPNDEPMFEFFPYSFAVANIKKFVKNLKHQPGFVAGKAEADGFVQVAEKILGAQ